MRTDLSPVAAEVVIAGQILGNGRATGVQPVEDPLLAIGGGGAVDGFPIPTSSAFASGSLRGMM
ncbi:MAG TPA: hypothetical protein VMK12_28075 [Anaeromyxobacteraceae bacterium]|nr:hypothetical protein [Anaeromyxobacteraceae bacterium]